MNHLRNTVAAVVVTAALSLVAACGDLEEPATGVDTSVEKKGKSPATKFPVRDHTNRMDFGDGEATLPAKPKPSRDGNASRLDFGDDGRP